MKLLRLLVAVLVLLFPRSTVHAQVKAADLAGTWVGGLADTTGKTTKIDTLVLESSGQFRWNDEIFRFYNPGRLGRVAGDTIIFDKGLLSGGPDYKFALKDQQLLVDVDRTVLEKYVKALADSGTGGGHIIRGFIFKAILAATQNQQRVVYVFKRVVVPTPKP
jgi:hypothetical protein